MNIEAPQKKHEAALRRLWKEAFGDSDAFLDIFWATAFSPSRCRCVTEGDRVLSALYWFDASCRGERLAYLYAIATAESQRGKGLCRRLMEDTHRLLREKGYRGALLVPSEPSLFGFYGRLGYQTATYIEEISAQASERAISLHPLTGTEYAHLRRRYLPEGGVVQEGEALALLEKSASFYRGEGVLLAVECEKGRARLAELLGDAALLPDILCALRCKEGSARTVGEGRPFSMLLPLAPEAPCPSYFGLALD